MGPGREKLLQCGALHNLFELRRENLMPPQVLPIFLVPVE